jgi:aspartate/methionine/tyrosine aminotransferase
LTEKHQVTVVPGTAFGIRNQCLLRIAHGALQKDSAAESIGRLVHGLGQVLAT